MAQTKKIYYAISEVSDLVGTPAHVLRYWEEEFPFLRPPKRRTGARAYRDQDIERVRRIKELLYEEGYTIKGARKRLRDEIAGRVPPVFDERTITELSEIENGLVNLLRILDGKPELVDDADA